MCEPSDERPRVIWRCLPPADPAAADDRFFKILLGDGFTAAYFRCLVATYRAYAKAHAAARAAGAVVPPELLEAELLFGANSVCVRMAWAPGQDAIFSDLDNSGAAVTPVARALVWLARHGLLYTDLREPNVRIDRTGDGPPRVTLVDYDDLVVVDGAPPATADDFLMRLHDCGAAFVGDLGTPGARPAVVAAIRAAWD